MTPAVKPTKLRPCTHFISGRSLSVILTVFCLQFLSIIALAQTPPLNPAKPVVAEPPKPVVLKDSIISIKNLRTQKDSAKINEVIAIRVYTLKPIDSLGNLYVNGMPMPVLKFSKSDNNEKMLYFQLSPNMQDSLLRFLKSSPFEKAIVPVYFSVGSLTKIIAKANAPIYVEVRQKLNKWWMFAAAFILAVIFLVALFQNILKDDQNLYYSLGRTQLFYWTVLVITAYLYICFKTDVLPDLPLSILAILGISVSTTAVSKIIENKDKGNVVIDKNAKSEGWFMDILSDGSSINIQRLQNVAFNVFFGMLFLQKALSNHLMPDFDSNVLILLGISSGAYAGLKTTEAQKEQKDAPVPTNDDGGGGKVVSESASSNKTEPAKQKTTDTKNTDTKEAAKGGGEAASDEDAS